MVFDEHPVVLNYNPQSVAQIHKNAINTPDEEKVESLLLLITWVSIFNCVMKMDYNAAIYLFLYYLWSTRKDSFHNKAYLIANAIFILSDIIWFLINMGSWSRKYEEENFSIWTSFRVYHIFTLITCVAIFILKALLLFFQTKTVSPAQAVPPPQQQQGNQFAQY